MIGVIYCVGTDNNGKQQTREMSTIIPNIKHDFISDEDNAYELVEMMEDCLSFAHGQKTVVTRVETYEITSSWSPVIPKNFVPW
jgi:hypothetical protein